MRRHRVLAQGLQHAKAPGDLVANHHRLVDQSTDDVEHIGASTVPPATYRLCLEGESTTKGGESLEEDPLGRLTSSRTTSPPLPRGFDVSAARSAAAGEKTEPVVRQLRDLFGVEHPRRPHGQIDGEWHPVEAFTDALYPADGGGVGFEVGVGVLRSLDEKPYASLAIGSPSVTAVSDGTCHKGFSGTPRP